MTKISRHDFPTRNISILVEMLSPKLQRKIEGASGDPAWLTSALAAAVQMLNVRCADDPTAAKPCSASPDAGPAFCSRCLATVPSTNPSRPASVT